MDHDAIDDDLNMSEDGLNDLRYYSNLYKSYWTFNV